MHTITDVTKLKITHRGSRLLVKPRYFILHDIVARFSLGFKGRGYKAVYKTVRQIELDHGICTDNLFILCEQESAPLLIAISRIHLSWTSRSWERAQTALTEIRKTHKEVKTVGELCALSRTLRKHAPYFYNVCKQKCYSENPKEFEIDKSLNAVLRVQ